MHILTKHVFFFLLLLSALVSCTPKEPHIRSDFRLERGSYIIGSTVRIAVDVEGADDPMGRFRLSLCDQNGTIIQVIEEKGFPFGEQTDSTVIMNFISIIQVTPGDYQLILAYQHPNQAAWHDLPSDRYAQSATVCITEPDLEEDMFEPNDTSSLATTLIWEIDREMADFSTLQASFHSPDDVDYYQLSFPEAKDYCMHIDLYDKHHTGSGWYENADAQFAYSIGGEKYAPFLKDSATISFHGPTTLYLQVRPTTPSGIGYYELCGNLQ